MKEDKYILPAPADLIMFKSEGFLGKTISNYPNLENINKGLGILEKQKDNTPKFTSGDLLFPYSGI